MWACEVVHLRHALVGIVLTPHCYEDCTNSCKCPRELNCEGPICMRRRNDIRCCGIIAERQRQALARHKMLGNMFAVRFNLHLPGLVKKNPKKQYTLSEIKELYQQQTVATCLSSFKP